MGAVRFSSGEVNVELDGAMVAASDVRVDVGVDNILHEAFGDDEVVDAPPDVVGARIAAKAPPCVGIFCVWVQGAEGVGESSVKQGGHLGALFISEARVFSVGFWVFEVDFVMGNIEVAAEDEGFDVVEPLQVMAEFVFPAHAVAEPSQFLLGVGGVDVDEIEGVEFKGNDAAFAVVFFHADAIGSGKGFFAGEDGGAGVAFFDGTVPVFLVARQVNNGLSLLHFGFLQADDVGIKAGNDVNEAFAKCRAQAVYVP